MEDPLLPVARWLRQTMFNAGGGDVPHDRVIFVANDVKLTAGQIRAFLGVLDRSRQAFAIVGLGFENRADGASLHAVQITQPRGKELLSLPPTVLEPGHYLLQVALRPEKYLVRLDRLFPNEGRPDEKVLQVEGALP